MEGDNGMYKSMVHVVIGQGKDDRSRHEQMSPAASYGQDYNRKPPGSVHGAYGPQGSQYPPQHGPPGMNNAYYNPQTQSYPAQRQFAEQPVQPGMGRYGPQAKTQQVYQSDHGVRTAPSRRQRASSQEPNAHSPGFQSTPSPGYQTSNSSGYHGATSSVHQGNPQPGYLGNAPSGYQGTPLSSHQDPPSSSSYQTTPSTGCQSTTPAQQWNTTPHEDSKIQRGGSSGPSYPFGSHETPGQAYATFDRAVPAAPVSMPTSRDLNQPQINQQGMIENILKPTPKPYTRPDLGENMPSTPPSRHVNHPSSGKPGFFASNGSRPPQTYHPFDVKQMSPNQNYGNDPHSSFEPKQRDQAAPAYIPRANQDKEASMLQQHGPTRQHSSQQQYNTYQGHFPPGNADRPRQYSPSYAAEKSYNDVSSRHTDGRHVDINIQYNQDIMSKVRSKSEDFDSRQDINAPAKSIARPGYREQSPSSNNTYGLEQKSHCNDGHVQHFNVHNAPPQNTQSFFQEPVSSTGGSYPRPAPVVTTKIGDQNRINRQPVHYQNSYRQNENAMQSQTYGQPKADIYSQNHEEAQKQDFGVKRYYDRPGSFDQEDRPSHQNLNAQMQRSGNNSFGQRNTDDFYKPSNTSSSTSSYSSHSPTLKSQMLPGQHLVQRNDQTDQRYVSNNADYSRSNSYRPTPATPNQISNDQRYSPQNVHKQSDSKGYISYNSGVEPVKGQNLASHFQGVSNSGDRETFHGVPHSGSARQHGDSAVIKEATYSAPSSSVRGTNTNVKREMFRKATPSSMEDQRTSRIEYTAERDKQSFTRSSSVDDVIDGSRSRSHDSYNKPKEHVLSNVAHSSKQAENTGVYSHQPAPNMETWQTRASNLLSASEKTNVALEKPDMQQSSLLSNVASSVQDQQKQTSRSYNREFKSPQLTMHQPHEASSNHRVRYNMQEASQPMKAGMSLEYEELVKKTLEKDNNLRKAKSIGDLTQKFSTAQAMHRVNDKGFKTKTKRKLTGIAKAKENVKDLKSKFEGGQMNVKDYMSSSKKESKVVASPSFDSEDVYSRNFQDEQVVPSIGPAWPGQRKTRPSSHSKVANRDSEAENRRPSLETRYPVHKFQSEGEPENQEKQKHTESSLAIGISNSNQPVKYTEEVNAPGEKQRSDVGIAREKQTSSSEEFTVIPQRKTSVPETKLWANNQRSSVVSGSDNQMMQPLTNRLYQGQEQQSTFTSGRDLTSTSLPKKSANQSSSVNDLAAKFGSTRLSMATSQKSATEANDIPEDVCNQFGIKNSTINQPKQDTTFRDYPYGQASHSATSPSKVEEKGSNMLYGVVGKPSDNTDESSGALYDNGYRRDRQSTSSLSSRQSQDRETPARETPTSFGKPEDELLHSSQTSSAPYDDKSSTTFFENQEDEPNFYGFKPSKSRTNNLPSGEPSFEQPARKSTSIGKKISQRLNALYDDDDDGGSVFLPRSRSMELLDDYRETRSYATHPDSVPPYGEGILPPRADDTRKTSLSQPEGVRGSSPYWKEGKDDEIKDEIGGSDERGSPPLFSCRLSDVCVTEGDVIQLRVMVTGTQPLNVCWFHNKKEIAVNDEHYQLTHHNSFYKLRVAEAVASDAGLYECEVSNQWGDDDTMCMLTVTPLNNNEESSASSHHLIPQSSAVTGLLEDQDEEPPFIEDLTPQYITVCAKETIRLVATYQAKPPPNVTWLRDRTELVTGGNVTIETRECSSALTVTDCCSDDTGCYTIRLDNDLGKDQMSASVTVQDVPEAPVGQPSITRISSTSLVLSWSGPSYDGGSPVTAYKVEQCQGQMSSWQPLTDSCKDTSFQVTGIVPETEYRFRVSVANKLGFSSPGHESDPITTIDERNIHTDSDLDYLDTDPSTPLSGPLSPLALMAARDELAFTPREVAITPGRKFHDYYTTGVQIGKGRFGNVFKCTEKFTAREFAAKFIRVKPSTRAELQGEMKIMNQLHHPKLLLLWDAFESAREIVLILEHVAGGELFERIIDEDYILTERECIHFMRQICEGVKFMHNKNILHLDLKPENILCVTCNSNEIKIIDFGLARKFDPTKANKVMFGTPEFVAPEVVNYDQIGYTTDMWSVGVICYILLTGLSPFLGDNEAETLANVTMAQWEFDEDVACEISADSMDFVSKLLKKSPRSRMTAEQCLDHPWLSQDVKFMRAKRLSTDKHRRFIARSKWQKTGTAIRALGRMAIQKGGNRDSVSSRGSRSSSVNSDSVYSPEPRSPMSPPMSSHDLHLDVNKNIPQPQAEKTEPRFVQAMNDLVVDEGQTASFKVKVKGYPAPRLTWLKQGQEIAAGSHYRVESLGEGVFKLTILNCRTVDDAEYECRAENSEGRIRCHADLFVEPTAK